MKSIVTMAGLVALVCTSLPAFAKVQGTGLAIADATLAHAKTEQRDRAIDAARDLASHRTDGSGAHSHRG
jgi:predicted secreted hydrolase